MHRSLVAVVSCETAGDRLYVVGEFTKINGAAQPRFVQFRAP